MNGPSVFFYNILRERKLERRLPESHRAKERQKERKEGTKQGEGWEVSRPEILCSSPCWKHPTLPLQAVRFLLDLTSSDRVSDTDSGDDEEVEMTGQSESMG